MALRASQASRPVTLIATLGGQPQVVSFALDYLLAREEPIGQVIVITLEGDDGRAARSLAKLTNEFSNGRYAGRSMALRLHPIHRGDVPLVDIYNEGDANAVWESVNHLLSELKSEDHTLHICISGGRRMLGLLTLSAAMLHFGHQDTLWHMYTPPELRQEADEGAVMHAPAGAGFRLVRVPMMPWGSYFPIFRELAGPAGSDVLARPRAAMDAAERRRCEKVVAQLTRAEREVLELFAQGLTPEQVARRRHTELSTVDTHKTEIFIHCREAWDLDGAQRLDYRFLREKFEGYFAAKRPA